MPSLFDLFTEHVKTNVDNDCSEQRSEAFYYTLLKKKMRRLDEYDKQSGTLSMLGTTLLFSQFDGNLVVDMRACVRKLRARDKLLDVVGALLQKKS